MSRYLDSSTTTQMAQIMIQYGRPSRSSWKEFIWSSFGRTIMGKAIWEHPIEIWLGEGFQLGNAYSCTVKKGYSYLCMWMMSNWLERKNPMWKVLNKEVDLGEPTSFLDHVYLECTQRLCEIRKDIVDNCRTMFESRISAGGVEKLPFPQNTRISLWSYDMAGHAKKCVERYCELANNTTQQLYKVSTPWMCKKQNSVSHSSTESEIISLDAGLRSDGKPALDLWDLIVAVLHGNTYQNNQERWNPCTNLVRAATRKLQTRKKSHGMIDDLDNVDFISSNVNSSRKESLLYVFEDNEAVIKMIIKGRSPTMRHVPRTHRVALYWLFDRINLEPKIHIKYIDTKNQLADIPTKGKFHTWRMESYVVFLQYQPFQFHQLSWSDVEKNARRCRWRKSHSKIEADDEFGLTMQREGSERACLYCIRKPGETRSESQLLLSSWTEQQPRTVRLVMGASSSDYSDWYIDEKWSSQEWKPDEMLEARTGRPVGEQQADSFTQHTDKFVIDTDDMDSDTATESYLSLKSMSFLHRVNDRLRKIFDHSSKGAIQDIL